MTRPLRFLSGFNSPSTTSAEAPEPVKFESDFVVILAALFCALICVVGLVAVARCAWLRRGGAVNDGSAGRPSANKGLKQKFIQTLPKFTYDSAAKGELAADCAICLAEYADGDEIRVLPQCGHGFHVGCIDTWLCSHSSCPSCRQILLVARCRKCGEYPAIANGAGIPIETEMKARQDGAATSSDFLP